MMPDPQAVPPFAAPCLLMVAPNGARRTKADHPNLPIGPQDLAREAAACLEAGAAAMHLHVRDAALRHSLDADLYREALAAVRAAVGDRMILQVTTEAVGRFTPAEQIACVRDVRPEAVSLAVRELVPDAAQEAEAARFFAWLRAERIWPQFILYDAEDVRRFNDLRRRGVIPDGPAFLLFVLGRYLTDRLSAPADLLPFLKEAEPHDFWAVCAFGAHEGACALTAAALGGHSRIGFENNLFLAGGQPAASNAALIAQAADGVSRIGRALAKAADVRALMMPG